MGTSSVILCSTEKGLKIDVNVFCLFFQWRNLKNLLVKRFKGVLKKMKKTRYVMKDNFHVMKDGKIAQTGGQEQPKSFRQVWV